MDMRRGDEFPPIQLARVGGELCVIDGFHRVEAARAAGIETIPAYISPLSEPEAVRAAIAANAKHGLNLSGKDKRRCFEIYCKSGAHRRSDGAVKSLRQIRTDLDGIAWPQTISNWLRKAGITPAEDPKGPNVAWADEEPETAELMDFMDQLHSLENMFHRLGDDDQETAGERLDGLMKRLFASEPVQREAVELDI